MCDVAQRILQLLGGQGTLRPIGEATGFIERLFAKGVDENFVAYLLAKTADHRRNLRIENRGR